MTTDELATLRSICAGTSAIVTMLPVAMLRDLLATHDRATRLQIELGHANTALSDKADGRAGRGA